MGSIRLRLAQLAAHLVVALVALVVIGVHGNEQMFVVGRDGDPIGTLDFIREDAFDDTIQVDSIDTFDR